jgi:Ca2+-binding EF-hand superfamily protein
MKRIAAAACALMSAMLAGISLPAAWPEEPARGLAPLGPVLLLPGGKEPFRLRLELTVRNQPPTQTWEAFLDRLFDWFDRDGDGLLDRAEASRIFPLPLPGGKPLTIDFALLDLHGKGKASRADLKAFCRNHGFGPVIAFVQPPSSDDLRLANLFVQCFGVAANGKLTPARLRQAPELLRKYDLNEDGFLDVAELPASTTSAVSWGNGLVTIDTNINKPCTVFRLDVADHSCIPTVEGELSKLLWLESGSGEADLHRLFGPDGRWAMAFRTSRAIPDVRSVAEFLVAQFKAALGERPALRKDDLEQDPGLSGLLDLFPLADRNGDGRLTLPELESYLGLVELGMQAQIWIQVKDHDRNPFHFLDRDGDGRLSYRELSRASDLVRPDMPEVGGLPLQVALSFGGPSVNSWGGVPIPASARASQVRAIHGPLPPPWFRAMDRNGDGVISPAEFLGPPEVFRKLDTNGDGVISPDEAIRAKNR